MAKLHLCPLPIQNTTLCKVQLNINDHLNCEVIVERCIKKDALHTKAIKGKTVAWRLYHFKCGLIIMEETLLVTCINLYYCTLTSTVVYLFTTSPEYWKTMHWDRICHYITFISYNCYKHPQVTIKWQVSSKFISKQMSCILLQSKFYPELDIIGYYSNPINPNWHLLNTDSNFENS